MFGGRVINPHPNLEQLQAYAAGEADELHEHVEQCEICHANLQLLSEVDRGLQSLPELSAPAGQWETISQQLEPRRRPLLAASIAFVALIGAGVLAKQLIDRSNHDPVAELENIYNDAGADPEQQAVTLKALSDAAHDAVEKDPDNAALHDLAYAIDRKRNEIAPDADAPDSSAVDSVRSVAEPTVEVIARNAPRVKLFNNAARAFGGAHLLAIVDGLRVVDVLPGSPAANAGLKADDVLLTANAVPVRTVDDLVAAAASGTVNVVMRRGTERITATLDVAARP